MAVVTLSKACILLMQTLLKKKQKKRHVAYLTATSRERFNLPWWGFISETANVYCTRWRSRKSFSDFHKALTLHLQTGCRAGSKNVLQFFFRKSIAASIPVRSVNCLCKISKYLPGDQSPLNRFKIRLKKQCSRPNNASMTCLNTHSLTNRLRSGKYGAQMGIASKN